VIVVEGDSVPNGQDVQLEERWSNLLSKSRNTEVLNISRKASTAGDVLLRLGEAKSREPRWYVVQIGQGSMYQQENRSILEPVYGFRSSLTNVVEEALEFGMKVCLMTPPIVRDPRLKVEIPKYLSVIRRLSAIYRTALLDTHALMAEEALYAKPEEIKEWFISEPTWSHYSTKGHQKVAGYFDRPENNFIGR
jgi:hypothetical protein